MKKATVLLLVFFILIAFTGCTNEKNNDTPIPTETSTIAALPSPAETAVAVASEAPVAPEVNPPGDIPDSQVFIEYTSAHGGYSLQVPEGWARTENNSTDVNFVDKFDGISVTISESAYTLSTDSVTHNFAPILQSTERAVTIKSTNEVKFTSGDAVVIAYSSNSNPDSVTNKQIRLENEAVIFISNGKMAVIRMWAPEGADNVDQWNLMKNSFKWN